VGCVGLWRPEGWPELELRSDVKEALFWVALLAAMAGVVEALRPRAALLLRPLVCVAVPLYALNLVREAQWEGVAAVGWSTLVFALALGAGVAGDALARRRPGASLPAAWLAALAVGAGALSFGGSASLAQLAGGLCPPLAVATLCALLRPGFSFAPGGATVLFPLHTGLVAAGVFVAELPSASAALLFAAPCAAWVRELPALRRLGPRAGALVAVLACALCAGAATWLAWTAMPEDPYGAYR